MTSNRRKDGRLRPSVIRARLRRRGLPFVTHEDVESFKAHTDARARIWNSIEIRDRLRMDVETLGERLEAIAEQQRWRKLRDTAGVVRAIACPKNHPARKGGVDVAAYRAHVLALVLSPLDWEEAA